ncbi:mitochondrial import inner membrane translocase s ubunit tim17 b-like protein [Trichuris trichiura]|uniref:Mitochondrial import inner membrane translocase s ubunit tim17 b-like protein n=1 Tax=Trichuris trichiura TaxID=36087 RepID=A0A077YZH1_TRITR|nr:mitochondrial import inner membrane translocase s ubunit tim17 b-like protein [Trichuris trichiura]
MEEYTREPCPWRIVDDCGGAFSMGAVGGGIFHGFRGMRTAPAGLTKRLIGGFSSLRERAPIVGGQFAVWGGVFSAVDCTLAHVRRKEDPWNSIISGAMTGALVTMRNGVGTMIGSAIMGGVILAMIEGVGIFITRFTADQFRPGKNSSHANLSIINNDFSFSVNPSTIDPNTITQPAPSTDRESSSSSSFPLFSGFGLDTLPFGRPA